MQISVAKTDRKEETEFIPTAIQTIGDLVKVATTSNWSTSVFDNNYRNNTNFKYAEYMALDIDNNDESNVYTLAQAKKDFKDYEFAIMPSRSYMKEKNGVVAERFRIVVKLSEVITDCRVFTHTYRHLTKVCGEEVCDKTVDAARYWFKSPFMEEIVYFQGGKGFKVVEPEPIVELDIDDFLVEGERGKLSNATLRFLMEGVDTNREPTLYKAARDFNEQGYSKQEAIVRFEEMSQRVPNWYQKGLSSRDMSTIDRAYGAPAKHPPRGVEKKPESPFNFGSLKYHVETQGELSWLVDGLLIDGGFSVIAADPKWGKSTVARQIATAVVKGGEFLEREVRQGKVLYFAFEEEPKMLSKQFRAVGMDLEHPNFTLHIGDVFDPEAVEHLANAIADIKPDLVVLDRLFSISKVESVNSYSEVDQALSKIRKIARDNNCHVLGVHHTNKNDKAGGGSSAKIMGSNAIYGAVDAMIIGYKRRERRFISSTGRGTINFDNHELSFDKATETYTMGRQSIDVEEIQ